MSNSYRNITVAGSGNLGSFIVEELVKLNKYNVTVLSRSADKSEPGATVKAVDYSSIDTLAEALEGSDVVINVLNVVTSATSNTNLVHASKKAGVKLFVPSEFGNNTTDIDQSSPFYGKLETQNLLQKIGLPYLLIFNGPFADNSFDPFLGIDLPNGKATWVGDGNAKISWTSRRDIARFLAYVLSNLGTSQLENRILRIEGSRVSFNEAISIYEISHPGKKVEVTKESLEEGEKFIADHPQSLEGLIKYLFVAWAKGDGLVNPGGERLDNDLYADWNPLTVEEVLKKLD